MELNPIQEKSLEKLIDYTYAAEILSFEETFDVETDKMTAQEIIDLCEAEGYDHILYHILVLILAKQP